METTESSPPAEISRVAVRLSLFWAEWPAVWFVQTEEQFTLAGISGERTKFCYVISHLDHRYTAEVKDILTSPPVREPYTTLKTELVRRLSPSREQHNHQLLTLEEMGNHNPSQFLRQLRSLSSNVFIRRIWSGRLPPQRTGHPRRPDRGRLGRRSPHLRGYIPAGTRERCPTPRQHHTSAAYRGLFLPGGSTQFREGPPSLQLQELPPGNQIPLPRRYCTNFLLVPSPLRCPGSKVY
jgi:hypothetical protein